MTRKVGDLLVIGLLAAELGDPSGDFLALVPNGDADNGDDETFDHGTLLVHKKA